MQAPFSVAGGLGLFFSIPKTFTSGQGVVDKGDSVGAKLKRIDYFGAVLMVRISPEC